MKSKLIFVAITLFSFTCSVSSGFEANKKATGQNTIIHPEFQKDAHIISNEIIVKFCDPLAQDLEDLKEQGEKALLKHLPQSLRQLNQRYHVSSFRQLCPHFAKSREHIQSILRADPSALTKKDKRLVERLQRAPKGKRIPNLQGIYKLRYQNPFGEPLQVILDSYRSDPHVEYASPNYAYSIHLTPNDPHFGTQWSLHNTGQMYSYSGSYNTPPGTPDSDIDAPEAWDVETGGEEIVIAVIDTGVDYNHRDLSANIWVNQAEQSGSPGIDDDGNGYIDDIYGYDFLSHGQDPDSDPIDESGHGTHCAGIATGTGGAEGQYIGIAPGARFVDVKVLNDWGLTTGDQVIEGIEWCIENKEEYNIRILSLSIGELLTGNDNGLGTQGRLVNTAADFGLVCVIAAGNDGPNNNGFSSLAAADSAITVGAVDEQETTNRKDDRIADFSNRGPRADDGDEDEIDEYKPDVVAPGVGIMSALFSSTQVGILTGYQQMSGTSMACPHVAGLAALILEADPNLTPTQVKQILHETSEARGVPYHSVNDPKYSKDYGWGIIDAYEAIKKIIGEDYQTINVISHNMYEKVYNIVTIYGTASINKGDIQAVEYKIDDGEWEEIEDGGEDWTLQWDTTAVVNGVHKVYIRSFDGIEYSNEFGLSLEVVNIGCEIISPQNGSKVKNAVTVKGTSFGLNVINVLVKIGNEPWMSAEPEDEPGNMSKWEYSWDTQDFNNGKYTISVKAYNGEWYSIPVSIEASVDNHGTAGGFLVGFDWIFIIIGILLFVMINYNKRKKIKN